MKFSLPEFALRRPITVSMVVVTMMGLGLIALNRTPIEFLPALDAPYIGCYIPYPGATPAQVEQEVTIHAEGEFRTVPGLKQIFTRSNSQGCWVSMLFTWDVDMGTATAEVRDRIERLKLVLPQEVDHIFLQRNTSDTLPVMVVSMAALGDDDDFAHHVRNVIGPKLKRIDGVADVVVHGPEEQSVLIEFDQNGLRRHNLSLYDVMLALQTSSLNMSVGELYDGDMKHYVRVLGEFSRPEELANLVVGPNGLRLKEVASVGYGDRERRYRFSIDRKAQVVLFIQKDSQANTVATCKAVREQLEALSKAGELHGAQYSIFFDQADIILGAVNGLLSAGKYGGLMALAVLFLFLRKFRPTVLVALAIPSSLVVAFVYMFFAGMSLNLITMMSMIISIGMLVDNSIVVIENIYRRASLGDDPRESALRGASEVGMAITASTLTTAVVFVPVLYVEAGELSTYMRQFAAPVCVALAGSLIVALTVIPLVVSRFRPREELKSYRFAAKMGAHLPTAFGNFWKHPHWLAPFRWISSAYAGLLAISQRWRLATILCIAAIGYITVRVPMQEVGVQGMPDIDLRRVRLDIEMDQNFDLARAEETFTQLEDYIDGYREELGIKNIFMFHDNTRGNLDLYLMKSKDYPEGVEPKYSSKDVLDILWMKLPERIPGVKLTLSSGEGQAGSRGSGGSGGRISVLLTGDNYALVRKYGEQLKERLEAVHHVSDVSLSARPPKKEIQLQIDESRAAAMGVSPTTIAQTVSFALQGTGMVPDLKQRGREIPVWTQFREEDRKKRSNLEQVALLGTAGNLVPLKQLASFTKTESPQDINRLDGKNYVWVSAHVSGDNLSWVKRDLEEVLASFRLPPGYETKMGHKLVQLDENFGNFLATLLLAVVLIYLVMSALFESFLIPLSILTTVPLAYIGVYWMMYLTSTPMDTVAFIGCILMVGVVVNNGIVIVDRITQLRRSGSTRYEAIIQAGHDRFRPVIMTAMTTILGAVPLALAGGASDIRVPSLGRALIGGLTTGTVLTLVVVPLFYSLIDDFREWCTGFVGTFFRMRRSRGEAV